MSSPRPSDNTQGPEDVMVIEASTSSQEEEMSTNPTTNVVQPIVRSTGERRMAKMSVTPSKDDLQTSMTVMLQQQVKIQMEMIQMLMKKNRDQESREEQMREEFKQKLDCCLQELVKSRVSEDRMTGESENETQLVKETGSSGMAPYRGGSQLKFNREVESIPREVGPLGRNCTTKGRMSGNRSDVTQVVRDPRMGQCLKRRQLKVNKDHFREAVPRVKNSTAETSTAEAKVSGYHMPGMSSCRKQTQVKVSTTDKVRSGLRLRLTQEQLREIYRKSKERQTLTANPSTDALKKNKTEVSGVRIKQEQLDDDDDDVVICEDRSMDESASLEKDERFGVRIKTEKPDDYEDHSIGNRHDESASLGKDEHCDGLQMDRQNKRPHREDESEDLQRNDYGENWKPCDQSENTKLIGIHSEVVQRKDSEDHKNTDLRENLHQDDQIEEVQKGDRTEGIDKNPQKAFQKGEDQSQSEDLKMTDLNDNFQQIVQIEKPQSEGQTPGKEIETEDSRQEKKSKDLGKSDFSDSFQEENRIIGELQTDGVLEDLQNEGEDRGKSDFNESLQKENKIGELLKDGGPEDLQNGSEDFGKSHCSERFQDDNQIGELQTDGGIGELQNGSEDRGKSDFSDRFQDKIQIGELQTDGGTEDLQTVHQGEDFQKDPSEDHEMTDLSENVPQREGGFKVKEEIIDEEVHRIEKQWRDELIQDKVKFKKARMDVKREGDLEFVEESNHQESRNRLEEDYQKPQDRPQGQWAWWERIDFSQAMCEEPPRKKRGRPKSKHVDRMSEESEMDDESVHKRPARLGAIMKTPDYADYDDGSDTAESTSSRTMTELEDYEESSGSDEETVNRKRKHPASDELDEKRRRNRIAVVKCRTKQKQWLRNLEKRIADMHAANDELQEEASKLRSEVILLRQILLAHRNCEVTKMQQRAFQAYRSSRNNQTGATAANETQVITIKEEPTDE